MKLVAVLLCMLYTGIYQSDEAQIIVDKLNNQADCWNRGDIEAFMADYWKSDELLFVGKAGVTYGWEKTLKNYQRRYPTSKEMGQLKFEIVELDRLGADLFFMVGKWNLTREIGDISGHFSLIWKKIDDNWVIISDHSS
jgi:ketosteroid isomerase-like protein